MSKKNTQHPFSLYFITEFNPTLHTFEAFTQKLYAAISGGVTCIQLRQKALATSEYTEVAKRVLQFLKPLHIPLIINDNAWVAKAAHADGLHIGQKDISPKKAREILGPDPFLGLSIENTEQALQALKEPIDYIAASPVFATQTKKDAGAPLGLPGLQKIHQAVDNALPVLAIGGIQPSNAALVKKAGAEGICVISSIEDASDPRLAALALFKSFHGA